ncbi:hypothetical protein C1645_775524 [Glomus cerebriforme]|uniref:RING-type domain-containing protein n=1 Tax=Glomus cerebriforme TaxID=658196 RepID=A0A397SR66_9GLOM|nr:hypothetical protein C1645_775524 [Glomus cerebriforme]
MRPEDNVCHPPKCFCGLLASPAYSEEFGLLYECHYLHNNPWKEVTEEQSVESETVNGRGDQSDNSVASSSLVPSLSSSARQPTRTVCGYHIHKDAWDSFFVNKHMNANHQELAVCPFFNFTFCAFFDLRNSYPLSHPPPPNCFCGLPVTMRYMNSRAEFHGRKLMFTCPNYLIDGARPKCTWKLWADEVPFQRPNGCTHPLQRQGATRLLDPSRQIQNLQNCNRSIAKRGTFNNHHSVSRNRFENNINNNAGRFYKRDSNHHSSERSDRRRRDDFGSRDYNHQHQQPAFSNGSSSVSRRSNGTGWDPGRIRGCKPPTRRDSDLNGTYHDDNSNGQIINKNNSTDRQSIESSRPLNIDENNVGKATIKESLLKSENDKLMGCKDKDSCNNQEKNNDISSNMENQELKSPDVVNNSNRERPVFDVRKSDFDTSMKTMKNCPSPDSSPRSDYSEESYYEGNGSPSLSNGADSSRFSMDNETSYISTYNEFSQTKPACIANVTPNYNFVAEASRLWTENKKLLSENQSLISKQENDKVEKSNLVMQVEQLKSEVNYLQNRVGHYKSEYASEQKFRQSSQKKLIELQAQVADVMKEIDELRFSKEKEKEESAMGNMKCKVCFEENITHALLPCHHLALCSKCSQVITKCVICRKPKENVVRIYLG